MQIIYKGKDDFGKDKYLVRIFLRRTAGGKRLFHSKLIHGGKKKAQEYGHQAQVKRDLGTLEDDAPVHDPTLTEYLDTWLLTFKKPTVRERTYEGYEYILKQYIRPHLGKCRLSELTTEIIQRTYNKLVAQEYSARTICFAHTLLKEALDQAIDSRLIPYNPAAKTRRPPKKKPTPKSLTEVEAERFIEEASKDKYAALFLFALAIGARPEEYFAVRWSDIDLKKQEVTFTRSICWLKGGGWKIDEVKTDSGVRTVSFVNEVASALRKHRTAQQKLRMRRGYKYEHLDLVFANRNGAPLHFRNITLRHLAPIMERAKIEGKFNLYRLRHSFVTLSLLNGADLKSVSRAAGHSTTSFTMDVYQTVLPTMRKDASEKIGDVLFKKRSGKKGV